MANDNWQTPPEVMNYLAAKERFTPTIDACASADNSLCERFYSEEDSFLDVDVTTITGEQIWCNPPYSKPLPFVTKCIELAENGNEVFMLLNMDASTKWFEIAEQSNRAILLPLIGGRVAFIVDGIQRNGNDRAQVFFKFNSVPNRRNIAEWESIYLEDINLFKE